MCKYCEKLPSAEELGFKLDHKSRHGRALVYDAFLARGKLTIDEIRKIAWPDDKPRAYGTINVFLSRMQESLGKHGLAILRGVGKDSGTYRLGPA